MSIPSNTLRAVRALRTLAPVLVPAICAMIPACGGGGYGGATHATSPAPTITTHPAGIAVSAGQPASVSVVATYASRYQWQRDGATIMGATAATHTIAVTAASDNGAPLRVVVSNVHGSVTRNPATLTVRSDGAAVRASPRRDQLRERLSTTKARRAAAS